MRDRSVPVLPVNIVLVLIGLADLVSTVFWLSTGQATEVNPIMAALLSVSPALFVLAKLATLGVYVAFIEWYRRYRNASFARVVSNVTVLSYVGIYSISFIAVNANALLR